MNQAVSLDEAMDPTIQIIFGTQTGTAEDLAYNLADAAEEKGLDVRVSDMEDVDSAQLSRFQYLLVLTSTYGDGDMPDNGVLLWKSLSSGDAPPMNNTHFSVLSLGDSSFPNFCAAGKSWDERLQELGAHRLCERVDCDNDYEVSAEQWEQKVIERLLESSAPAVEVPGEADVDAASLQTESGQNKREKPFVHSASEPMAMKLREKRCLTKSNSSKEVMHYEFELPETEKAYRTGDTLNLMARNEPALVNALLCFGDYDCEALVPYKGVERRLGDLLSCAIDLRQPTPKFLEYLAQQSPGGELENVLQASAQSVQDFLRGRDVLALLKTYSKSPIPSADLIALLAPLTPRTYSIASSASMDSASVALTVASVRYELDGRAMSGTGSCFLADRLPVGANVPAYFSRNRHFTVPEDTTVPVIMIGPGTGIAPFRGFLQERQTQGATGDNWLFFGDRNEETDFLYRDELENFRASGLLTRLDVAFSRDQSEKIYVQHLMRNHSATIYAWLERGAHLFVCGDAQKMAVDVEEALLALIKQERRCSEQEAETYLDSLRSAHRYERDVY
ncbi:MAG: flavodoxin domain-containing protein [Pseudomonadota bacterium]